MSSFSPTPAELDLVNKLFAVADPQKLGIVTGEKAVETFAGANLPPSVLGEIWSIADKKNNGFLTRKGVTIALRLIGHAQKGEKVQESLVEKPGPLAYLKSISPNPPTLPSSPPKSPPSVGASLHPPLTPEDKSKFLRLFLGCGPINGLLPGDKARDVFVKSKLPVETLSQVWALADTQDRGALDQADFTIAMYFIQAIMSGQLKSLPTTLPPGLYEQAGGRPPVGVVAHATGNSVSSLQPSLTGTFASAVPATPQLTAQTTGTGSRRLQAQTTGQEYNRMNMAVPARQPSVHFAPNPVAALGASAFGNASQPPWEVTPEEKARFDQFFDNLDTQKRGYIEGEVAVPFMLQSKLSEDTLAQVWDLADLNNDGKLTRDGFAVAMHLIQGKLAGKEVPATLPLSLVPPAMRTGRVGGAAAAPLSAPPPAPAVPEPVRDLLWDDSPPASAASPPQIVSAFGSPPPQGMSVLQPQTTGRLSQQPTGTGTSNPPPMPPRMTDPFGAPAFSPPTGQAHRDLLSDDEGTSSSAVPDNSAEIGNLQNQLNSTNKSLESTKAERQTTESTLATQASQLSALQTQLSSAKAAYETETKLLETLRERYASQTKDIAQTREQLIRAESDLSAVRVEKAEVQGSLLRDKEEVREFQRRMKEVNEEAESTKAEIDRLKKETKHQKGLLAIAKKQLATREAERAKLAKELEDAEREAQAAREELEKTETELANEPASIQTNGVATSTPTASPGASRMDTPSIAAQQPLPASPPPSIGSPSSMKATNPFERLMMQTTGSRPASPFAAPTSDIFSVSSPQIQQASASTTQSSPFAMSTTPEKALEAPKEPHAVATEPRWPSEDPFGVVDKASGATSVEETAEKMESPADIVSPSPPPETQPTVAPVETPGSLPKTPEKSASSDALDNAARQFPALDTQSPAVLPTGNEGHTDLDSKLVEKEQEESDSDSDNEGDFHDAKEARLSASSPTEEPRNDVTMGPANDVPKSPPGLNAFEDAFGLKEESKNESSVSGFPTNKNTVTDLFFSESQPTNKTLANGKASESGSPFDNAPNATAGVNAFDEALGKISSPGSSSGAPQFQLDAGFEDTFDFNAAKDDEPLALSLTAAPTVNGSSQPPAKPPVDFAPSFTPIATGQDAGARPQEAARPTFSFDDAFGSASASQGSPQPSQVPAAGDHGISFEEAFGGGTDRALALDFNPATSSSTHPGQPSEESMSHQVHSPPRSPRVTTVQTSPSTIRSSSPGPRPRRSTGSSTEGSPHSKPPPQHRHSKLSLRLPFGRKDKKKPKNEPPPMPPPQFLSPVSEPQGAQTPAVDDDVEPVKQLCGMGFSRSQAVDALERHGYDVQRALNSLLGSA